MYNPKTGPTCTLSPYIKLAFCLFLIELRCLLNTTVAPAERVDTNNVCYTLL